MCFTEVQLAAILAPKQAQLATAPAMSPEQPWGESSALGMGTGTPQGSLLQPQPGAGQLEAVASQMQALLMAGHRLQALKCAEFTH